MKSDEQIKKEVKKDLKKHIKEEKKHNEEVLSQIKQEGIRLKSMTPEEIVDWLVDQHEQYTSHINWGVRQGFLDGIEQVDRSLILTYIYHLTVFLTMRDVEVFDRKVAEILVERNEIDLLLILNVLNYV